MGRRNRCDPTLHSDPSRLGSVSRKVATLKLRSPHVAEPAKSDRDRLRTASMAPEATRTFNEDKHHLPLTSRRAISVSNRMGSKPYTPAARRAKCAQSTSSSKALRR